MIEKSFTRGAVVSERSGNYVPCILWSVLIIVGEIYVRSWNRTFEVSVWKGKEFRKAQSGLYSEFIGSDRFIEFELEITHEAQIQPLASSEYVFMVV